ncbi:predicted protein [Histoplasma capsulatum G186AR]|uniref:Uncharacterized protein n=1 Tax=Ajellomyces capsulatus (strain G186AR / H82 / ATCC MYA-2454 / RMSCC 2432) TaxID=447093 RepID=C0NVQ5_AJECG|nr:uncharacterized protein HCBG_07235 [Histoplasma capsulatum G186AR]EEH04594.1 predicted protein [Histoplasma capsulatum G186AR]
MVSMVFFSKTETRRSFNDGEVAKVCEELEPRKKNKKIHHSMESYRYFRLSWYSCNRTVHALYGGMYGIVTRPSGEPRNRSSDLAPGTLVSSSSSSLFSYIFPR